MIKTIKTRAASSGEDELTFSESVAQTGVPGQQGLFVVKAQLSSLLEAQDGQGEGYTFTALRHLQAADLFQGDAGTLPSALRLVPLVFKHQQHQAVWTHANIWHSFSIRGQIRSKLCDTQADDWLSNSCTCHLKLLMRTGKTRQFVCVIALLWRLTAWLWNCITASSVQHTYN